MGFRETVLLLSFLHFGLKERERQGEDIEKNLQERVDRKMYRIPALPGTEQSL